MHIKQGWTLKMVDYSVADAFMEIFGYRRVKMLNVNSNGYLLDPNDWNEEVMHELAAQDNVTLTETMIEYIMSAREFYAEYQTVPPIREFAKMHGMDRKAQPLYDLFPNGPMKMISKFAALPQPTGCV
jgi:dissimilatory sulfite reductase related protein